MTKGLKQQTEKQIEIEHKIGYALDNIQKWIEYMEQRGLDYLSYLRRLKGMWHILFEKASPDDFKYGDLNHPEDESIFERYRNNMTTDLNYLYQTLTENNEWSDVYFKYAEGCDEKYNEDYLSEETDTKIFNMFKKQVELFEEELPLMLELLKTERTK